MCLKWSINIFFQYKAEKFAEAANYRGIERMHYCGVLCTMCTSGIPVLLTVIFGPKLVGGIINSAQKLVIKRLVQYGGGAASGSWYWTSASLFTC